MYTKFFVSTVLARSASVVFVAAMCIPVLACRDRDAAAPAPVVIREVPAPDLSRAPEAVQAEARKRFAAIEQTQNADNVERGKAYGELGMLLMAAEYYGEAEVALQDAEALQPSEMRWPYYLGHVYRTLGDPTKAMAAYERAVEADGSYPPALVWLGNSYLDAGKIQDAEARFNQALAIDARLVAAHFGLGRAALARRDYATAIATLERGLAIDPEADAIRYPLALAYRGAGRIDQAQQQLRREGAGELRPPDPILDDVDVLLETPMAHEVRGSRALAAGKWDEAAQEFSRGVELNPDESALRHKLATALAMKGDTRGAMAQFRETIRRQPAHTKAHYSLGLLLAQDGDIAGGIREFEAAVAIEPNYVEARLQLAEALRRAGNRRRALAEYERVMQRDTRIPEARFGQAMVLVQTGRWAEARDRLQDGMAAFPDRWAFALALARVLAAAPDDRVRDGRRALAILEDVAPRARQSLDYGLAMAMTLAELGRFDEALMWQDESIGFAAGMRDLRLDAALAATRREYAQHRATRRPWSDAEPMEMHDAS